jgi:hypothetical protein
MKNSIGNGILYLHWFVNLIALSNNFCCNLLSACHRENMEQMQTSFGPTFWGMFNRCYSELQTQFLGTSWNVSYLNSCWFELCYNHKPITWLISCVLDLTVSWRFLNIQWRAFQSQMVSSKILLHSNDIRGWGSLIIGNSRPSQSFPTSQLYFNTYLRCLIWYLPTNVCLWPTYFTVGSVLSLNNL